MDFTALLLKAAAVILPDLLTQLGPTLGPVISNVVTTFKATTTPVPVGIPLIPEPVGSPIPQIAGKPSEFVRNGQHLINLYLKPVPPLVEDGWLGKKTEDVIRKAVAPYGIVL